MTMEILITALAKGAIGKFAGYPLNTILGYLIDQVTFQEKKIARFEQKLDQHITNPFRVGKVYLEEAKHAANTAQQREQINRALEAFISVSQVNLPGYQYKLLPIQAQFYVGVCYDLLADEKNALRWYKKSFQAVDEIYQSANRIRHTLHRFHSENAELLEPKTRSEKILFGALDKFLGAFEILDENVLRRKEAKEQDKAWGNFVILEKEVTSFRNFLASLLTSREPKMFGR